MKKILILLVTMVASATAWAIEQDSDGYYLIGSVDDWKAFAEIVTTTPNANARMVADVDLADDQTTVGPPTHSERNLYSGVFDGQGHTLTVAYERQQFLAPFTKISGATIKNLHIDGSIHSSEGPVGGVTAFIEGKNLISNVWVSADISCSATGWSCVGAFVGSTLYGEYVTLIDGLFTGTAFGTGSQNGCFIVGESNVNRCSHTNCLSVGQFSYYGKCSLSGEYNNCYVKQFPNEIPEAMRCTDEQLSDGTIAAALQGDREEPVWVQDEESGLPMLRVFMKPRKPIIDEVMVKGVTFNMVKVYSGVNQKENLPAYYYVGQCEVTEGLWEAIMGSNPCSDKRGIDYPAENMTWNECQDFLASLNKLTGLQFRLPTEAEWEFAARGGLESNNYTFSGSNTLNDVAWYKKTCSHKEVVGTKLPNELGIYDMNGNVYEFIQDESMICGGGWHAPVEHCYLDYRYPFSATSRDNDTGIRLAASAMTHKPGDVTGDGKVDIEDVNACINIILELKTREDYLGNADLVSDGKVDIEDVNAIINIILSN